MKRLIFVIILLLVLLGVGVPVSQADQLEDVTKELENLKRDLSGKEINYQKLNTQLNNIKAELVQLSDEIKKKEAGVKKDEVDYICAHGTGTPGNDKLECAAIKNVFNGQYKTISISSIKSMFGHTMGAASAIEALTCCLAVKENIIPPTINFETPDPVCDIDCVPNKARVKKVNIALNNGFAFGGNNSCLVIGKFLK